MDRKTILPQEEALNWREWVPVTQHHITSHAYIW